ncbi:FecCD family ABC transporter permease [Paenibacillus sp. sgz302251]|uniref:FecCD family ABC transporter permease n=1 Tax=Paenibacillus sp. sgz302251 TaxID=3414493 RepID=UPI003C7DE09A
MIAEFERKLEQKRRKSVGTLAILFLLILVSFLVSLNTGLYPLTPKLVLSTLVGYGTDDSAIVLFNIRLPRMVLALLIGIGLALAGAIMQGVSQNGLADPGILGINAGAGLAIVVYIAYFYEKVHFAPLWALPSVAFIGASFAAILVFLISYKKGNLSPNRLVLVGVAVGSGISALMLFLTYRMNAYTYEFVKIWLSGSVWGTNWDYVKVAGFWILLLVPLVIYKSRILNVFTLGDTLTKEMGVRINFERFILMVYAVALTSTSVAVGGNIGFVGLVAPHLSRQLLGVNHKWMLPGTALIGGMLVLISDTVGRTIVQPIEIPVGIIVAGLGTPYFIYLLLKDRR